MFKVSYALRWLQKGPRAWLNQVGWPWCESTTAKKKPKQKKSQIMTALTSPKNARHLRDTDWLVYPWQHVCHPCFPQVAERAPKPPIYIRIWVFWACADNTVVKLPIFTRITFGGASGLWINQLQTGLELSPRSAFCFGDRVLLL